MLENLKAVKTLNDFAELVGYHPSALAFILYKIPETGKYTKFSIPKKSGGTREISAPVEHLKQLQRRVANILYACRDEIDALHPKRRPLSHGFRQSLSIVTNAQRHKHQRYVFNIDLQDFFPSVNFGRVRGFFISNKNFELSEVAATIIAQIACHKNELPQGSPCSPVISDMICGILDSRLAKLSKKNRIAYSRYADDLTFSSNQKEFPVDLAECVIGPPHEWLVGKKLRKEIEKAGFKINPNKTRMQCRESRQTVTGLTVNRKVNVQNPYYRNARIMAHSLFRTGKYHYWNGPVKEEVFKLGKLEGMFSHIYYVKDQADYRELLDKRKNPTAVRKLYSSFLFYKSFVALNKPMVICEGKTDNTYLRYAVRNRTKYHPKLGKIDSGKFELAFSLFTYDSQASELLGLNGGSGQLNNFISHYSKNLKGYNHRPLLHPVIILIDNDSGAKEIFSTIKSAFKIDISLVMGNAFFKLSDNLYLVKTPLLPPKTESFIEESFPASVMKTIIDGKTFNHTKNLNPATEYGKAIFADKVIRAYAASIDFSGFDGILDRIASVIDDYKAPV